MTDMPTLEECEQAFSSSDNFIGSGRDRLGFRIPGSRWVYKKAKGGSEYVNPSEYRRYKRIISRELPKNVSVPEMHLLPNGVIASEYIDGETPKHCNYRIHDKEHEHDYDSCWWNWVQEFTQRFNLFDSDAMCNVRVIRDAEGNVTQVYIIDLGE